MRLSEPSAQTGPQAPSLQSSSIANPSTSSSTSSSTKPASLDVRDLHVRYPYAAAPVLAAVDVHVPPGGRLLVLGASGSGKSTLLRVLAGIVPQTVDADVSGHVRVAGLDPVHTPVPELAATVATLTQDPADQLCLPTVADEVAFACENRGVPREQIAPRVRDHLARVGAAHLAGRRTSELSGGEGQRVALAAALVAEPSVLLLDEPTALLDPDGAAAIGALLAADRRTSVLIEHRLDELGRLPERILLLDGGGRVCLSGATEEALLEAGAEVAATGAWLPLRAELSVALGHTIGAGPAAARAALAEFGPRLMAGPSFASAPQPAAGSQFAAGPGLAVGRPEVVGRATSEGAPANPEATSRHDRRGGVVLRAERFAVYRGAHAVVGGLDLELRQGQVTAVLGRNGSGKSSLLLGLAGLLPTTGALTGGRVGMVFQHPEHQFLARTVREEIRHGLHHIGTRRWSRGARAAVGQAARLGTDQGEARAAAATARFALTGLEDHDPFRLSGGQQRRLSLAAMAVLDDDVLLADEPTFGQDRRTTRAVADALCALAAGGRGVLLVSHDLRLVASIADEVVLLEGGRVLAQGPTGAVLGDGELLARAGLRLPPSVQAWLGSGLELRAVLRALDDALESALTGGSA